MLIGLIIVSKNALLIVSGEEYLGGVTSLQILSVAIIFSSLSNYYVSCILLPNKKEKIIILSTIISAVVNIALNLVLIPTMSLDGAALTTVIAEAIVVIIVYYAAGQFRQKNV